MRLEGATLRSSDGEPPPLAPLSQPDERMELGSKSAGCRQAVGPPAPPPAPGQGPNAVTLGCDPGSTRTLTLSAPRPTLSTARQTSNAVCVATSLVGPGSARLPVQLWPRRRPRRGCLCPGRPPPGPLLKCPRPEAVYPSTRRISYEDLPKRTPPGNWRCSRVLTFNMIATVHGWPPLGRTTVVGLMKHIGSFFPLCFSRAVSARHNRNRDRRPALVDRHG